MPRSTAAHDVSTPGRTPGQRVSGGPRSRVRQPGRSRAAAQVALMCRPQRGRGHRFALCHNNFGSLSRARLVVSDSAWSRVCWPTTLRSRSNPHARALSLNWATCHMSRASSNRSDSGDIPPAPITPGVRKVTRPWEPVVGLAGRHHLRVAYRSLASPDRSCQRARILDSARCGR
jgi:hypothetical protein